MPEQFKEEPPINHREGIPETTQLTSEPNLPPNGGNKSDLRLSQADPDQGRVVSKAIEDRPRKSREPMSDEELKKYRQYLSEKNSNRFGQAAARISANQCDKCGHVSKRQAKFCNKCGTALVPRESQPDDGGTRDVSSEQAGSDGQGLTQEGHPEAFRAKRWNRLTTYVVMATGLLIVSGLIFISQTAFKRSATQAESATASTSPIQSSALPVGESATPATSSTPLSNAELLGAAKTALSDGYIMGPNYRSWGKIADARLLLEQIQPGSPEFSEASGLLLEVRKREIEKEKWDKARERELYAENLQRMYLDRGINVAITVTGADKSIMKFSSTPMSRPQVEQMTSDPTFIDPLRQIGFEKITFMGRSPSTWVYDITMSKIVVSEGITKAGKPVTPARKPVAATARRVAKPKAVANVPRASYEKDQPQKKDKSTKADEKKKNKIEEKDKKKKKEKTKKAEIDTR